MGFIQEAWAEEKCRIESGIFFADDTAILISRNAEGVYAASNKRIPLSHLLSENGKDFYGYIDVFNSVESNEFVAKVGGTSWEGGGFVALLEKITDNLIWMIHFDNSEGFSDVEFADHVIRSCASYYPHENTLEVPITSPKNFKLTKRYNL